MSETRVIMIGIDGGTWDLFEPWAKEGKMPNLKKTYGWQGTMPFVTESAWP